MLASTHGFSTPRLPELLPCPVARGRETPETLKVVLALTVVGPGLLEEMVAEQAPATVVQLVLVTVLLFENEPPPLRLRLTVVPSGAATKPLPRPWFWETVAVTVPPVVLALVWFSSGVGCRAGLV